MKKTIEMKTVGGTKFSVELNVVREFVEVENNLDGHIFTTTDYSEITASIISVKGLVFDAKFYEENNMPKQAPAGTHALARSSKATICIDENMFDFYTATLNEMVEIEESKPEIVARIARVKASEKAEVEYYRHTKAVDNMMTLNGHSY